MSRLVQVNEQNFEAEVMHEELPVLVEFGATWCGPCKTMEPELIAFAAEMQGRVKVVQVDIDQSPMIAQAMGIRSVPTMILFKGGRPADGRQGAIRKAEMLALVEKFLPRAQGELKAKEVAALLKQGRIVMVDLRPAEVWGRSRIAGAVNFPLETFEGRLGELLTLGATPVLYCRTGADAKAVAQKMGDAGAPIAYLDGGVLTWETEGFRLDRPD
jgi:thioredoxin 1